MPDGSAVGVHCTASHAGACALGRRCSAAKTHLGVCTHTAASQPPTTSRDPLAAGGRGMPGKGRRLIWAYPTSDQASMFPFFCTQYIAEQIPGALATVPAVLHADSTEITARPKRGRACNRLSQDGTIPWQVCMTETL